PINGDTVWGTTIPVWTYVRNTETNPYTGISQNVNYYYLHLEKEGIVIGSIADNLGSGYINKNTITLYPSDFIGPLPIGGIRLSEGEYTLRMIIYDSKGGSWIAVDAPTISTIYYKEG
ncbi:MAG: hypothetical protein KJ587_20290, partial [Alphaproteobacteria bacterium]|nr:hypothetical protein [Alphaproteobacteria bacterium]